MGDGREVTARFRRMFRTWPRPVDDLVCSSDGMVALMKQRHVRRRNLTVIGTFTTRYVRGRLACLSFGFAMASIHDIRRARRVLGCNRRVTFGVYVRRGTRYPCIMKGRHIILFQPVSSTRDATEAYIVEYGKWKLLTTIMSEGET